MYIFQLQDLTAGTYNWTEKQQGYILSSFYIGYVLTHVPGGVIAERYGGKWTLSLGILSTAIFTILTPVAVDIGTSSYNWELHKYKKIRSIRRWDLL